MCYNLALTLSNKDTSSNEKYQYLERYVVLQHEKLFKGGKKSPKNLLNMINARNVN